MKSKTVICPDCHGTFKTQGFGSHRQACSKKARAVEEPKQLVATIHNERAKVTHYKSVESLPGIIRRVKGVAAELGGMTKLRDLVHELV